MSSKVVVQVGYTYTHDLDDVNPSYTGTNLLGQYEDGSAYNERWTHCLPVLARYSLLNNSTSHLKVDAILGLSLIRTSGVSSGEDRINYKVVSEYYEVFKANSQIYITGGLGFRYAFNSRFEGIFDWAYSYNFHGANEYVHLSTVGNKWGLTSAHTLGLRYCFNLKKSVK